jgi:hypothetical protein
MLVVDTFLYNEDEIVEERLRVMSPYVDRFYIVEASCSFSGKKKEKSTSKNDPIFAPYKDKIRFVTIHEFPDVPTSWIMKKLTKYNENFNSWWREAYQRSCVLDFIRKELKDEKYMLIVADVDEIVSPELLKKFKEDYTLVHPDIQEHPVFLTMFFYYYSWKWMKPEAWTRPFVVYSDVIERMANYSDSPTLLNDIRMEFTKEKHIPNAGWHLSYFMDAKAIARKIGHFAHTSLDQDQFKRVEWLERCIVEGLDPFYRSDQNCIPAPNIPYYMP